VKRALILIIPIAVLLIAGAGVYRFTRDTTDVEQPEKSFVQDLITVPQKLSDIMETAKATTTTLQAATIPGADPTFQFSGIVPTTWRAESVPAIDAINIFDPDVSDENNLEKSQIFVRQFSANTFLTLSTVTIWEVSDFTIDDRPARQYKILKKPGVPPFPNQPTWRNEEHLVTDIRVSNTNPSVFYVIAKRPDLDEKIYQDFLDSFKVIAQQDAELVEPVANFQQRITKKPFGVFVTPDESPISPERFTGYHTAVDVEYEDVAADVPVHAIADGTVLVARRASGYGGVIAIQHTIADSEYVAIYGHLEPASLVARGASVKAGEVIGQLGDGGTPEMDGERKHLHFGIKPGTDSDIRGYVDSEAELANWLDPLELF